MCFWESRRTMNEGMLTTCFLTLICLGIVTSIGQNVESGSLRLFRPEDLPRPRQKSYEGRWQNSNFSQLEMREKSRVEEKSQEDQLDGSLPTQAP